MATHPQSDRSEEINAVFCPLPTRVNATAVSEAQIPVSLDEQKKSFWCWAAVGRELCEAKPGDSYKDDQFKSQDTIAKAVLGNLCNTAKDVSDVLYDLHSGGWLSERYYRSNKTGPSLHQEMKDSVDRGDLISAVVQWNSDISHNVCVHGYIEGSQTDRNGQPVLSFWVYDPSGDDEKLDNRYILRADAFHQYPSWDPKNEVCVVGAVTAVFMT